MIVNYEKPTEEFQIPISKVYNKEYLAEQALVVGTPPWWANRLLNKLSANQMDAGGKIYKQLFDYYNSENNDTILFLPENLKDNVKSFLELSRTNFPMLIVSCITDRFGIKGIKTGSDLDYSSDAWKAWVDAKMPIIMKDIITYASIAGESYAILGLDKRGNPKISAESPLTMAVELDEDGEVMAAVKIYHDTVYNVFKLYLYLPGEIYIFKYENETLDNLFAPELSGFNNWSFEFEESFATGFDYTNVVYFENKDGAGEYEKHLSIIRRINTGVLNRLVVLTTQAHRQKMITLKAQQDEDGNIIDLPTNDPETGEELDYSSIVPSSPGEIGILPPGADIWESSQTDIQGHLSSTKQDVFDLAAVTSTLVTYLFSDGNNVSGASTEQSSESFYFKMEDRANRFREAFIQIAKFILDHNDIDYDFVEIAYDAFKETSLQQKSVSYSQLQGLPEKTKLSIAFGMSPSEIDEVEAYRLEEQVTAQISARAAEAATARVTGNTVVEEETEEVIDES